jgi:hypothetical protein
MTLRNPSEACLPSYERCGVGYNLGGFYSLARVVKVLLALVALFLAGGANWQVSK